MAWTLETASIRRYRGLSHEPKPRPGYQLDGSSVPESDIQPGSECREIDTGDLYVWFDGNWREYISPEAQRMQALDLRMTAILAELQAQTSLLRKGA